MNANLSYFSPLRYDLMGFTKGLPLKFKSLKFTPPDLRLKYHC